MLQQTRSIEANDIKVKLNRTNRKTQKYKSKKQDNDRNQGETIKN